MRMRLPCRGMGALCDRGCIMVALALMVGPLSAGRAQSNLSTQGFGFPTGQLSSRALGAGGSIGEMDPLSALNPAAIALLGSRILFFQIEPEYRTVTTANGSEATTTARYPNVFGAMPIGRGFVISVGASTLLDRTTTTSSNSTQFITPVDSVPMTTTFRIDGAMDDLRLAAGWTPVRWLRVGLGAHAITGHNLINLKKSFADTTQFAGFSQTRVLGFSGSAVSAGFQLVGSSVVASASVRAGGPLRMNAEDTVLSSARVPNRYGVSIAYTGIANSTLALRTSRDDWSSLGALGTPGLVGVDAWDTSIGGDIAGPKIGDRIVFVRAGYRDRTLPFQAVGQTVTEKSITGGLGTAFASGHVLTDLALVRANRSAGSVGASERAWTVSIGISVLP
jgi:hypothetical protein